MGEKLYGMNNHFYDKMRHRYTHDAGIILQCCSFDVRQEKKHRYSTKCKMINISLKIRTYRKSCKVNPPGQISVQSSQFRKYPKVQDK